jgi:putative membrane protein
MWGVAAALWIGSGLWRWLAGAEKSTDYYTRNHFFLAKMGLLLVVLLLEVWPMVKLIGWRAAVRGGAAEPVATPGAARRIVAVSYVQSVLIVLMVIFAVSMARGLGAMPGG